MVPSDRAVMAACNSLRPQPIACSSGIIIALKLYNSNELELVATPTMARMRIFQPILNSLLSNCFMVSAR